MSKQFELNQRIYRNGDVVLYQRPDHKNPKWQCRLHVPGATGYVIRSTKSADEFEARRYAEDLWDELRLKVKSGGALKSKSCTKFFDDFKESYKSAAPSERRYNDVCYNLEKYILVFLGTEPIDTIDTATISKYVEWRAKNYLRKPPSNNTLRTELVCFKTFMDWALRRGYTRNIIDWEPPSLDKNRRPHFTRNDWSTLTRFMRGWTKKGKSGEGGGKYRERLLLCQYVLILGNTGMRVGEARMLRWKDIESQQRYTAEGKKVTDFIFWVHGKTGSRDVVGRNEEIGTYLERIWEQRKAELGEEPKPEEYVFCHRDGQPIVSFKKGLEAMLKAADVLKSPEGGNRTAYSIRHTYATRRLEEGVNPYLLAKNMGTSVKMLENFYGHTTNRTNAEELTKTRRGGSQRELPRFAWEAKK